MNIIRIIRSLPVRCLHAFERFFDDFFFLFVSNKLYVYSWLQYKGTKVLHNNWGDDINKFFLESISSVKVKDLSISFFYRLFPVKGYSCIGSILGIFPHAKKYEVWGSGFIEPNMELKRIPKKVHSVRGPLTRQELIKKGIECPNTYGDPALLISRYYRKFVDKQYSWGIIPHYIDEDNPVLMEFCQHHPDFLLIRMHDYNDWHDIPDQIMLCSRIISSSLHGLIMADSYGVPNAWVRFTDKIQGGEFKYMDYLQSVGRDAVTPIIIRSFQDLERIIIEDDTSRAIDIDYRSIFNACPFKNKLIDYHDLIPQLSQYHSWHEKEQQYNYCVSIDTKSDLDKELSRLEKGEANYVFRGVKDARYKLYTLLQRHWLQKSDQILSLGTTDYYNAIKELIARTRSKLNDRACQQIQHINDDLYMLTIMQHFGEPSPIIVFTHSLRVALSCAISEIADYYITCQDSMSEYVSLYFVDNKINQEVSSQTDTKSGTERLRVFALNKNDREVSVDLANVNSCDSTGSSFPGGSLEHMFNYDPFFASNEVYIANNTIDQPLEEVVNEITGDRVFNCLNINKRLIPYLRKEYCIPNCDQSSLYGEGNEELRFLKQVKADI